MLQLSNILYSLSELKDSGGDQYSELEPQGQLPLSELHDTLNNVESSIEDANP